MESVSRISALVDPTRELTLEAATTTGTARIVNSRPYAKDVPFSEVKRLLESRNERDILDGLRRVINMMYQDKPCLPYFSAVVKNVANANVSIKKLVYIYLLHFAESEPDLALLAINAIQKNLSDQSPQVRAMALRAMSGIRVPVISQIVLLAIKRGIADMSPLVRKAAALAVPKAYRLDPSTLPQLLDFLTALLADRQYYVVGPAVTAFLAVCPDRIDLLHKVYRSLVRKLVDMDDWSQLAALRLLTIYSRKCFPRRMTRRKMNGTKAFYEDEVRDDSNGDGEEVPLIEPDLDLFLRACKPLLTSRNSAVIIAVARCFMYLGRPEDLDQAIGPMVALLRSPTEIQRAAIYDIIAVCLHRPQAFVKYVTHFLVHADDSSELSRLKFEIMTLVFPHCDEYRREIILSEFEHFAHSYDKHLVSESVRAVGRCAQTDPAYSKRCLDLLLRQITSQDDHLVGESLVVIRLLIQKEPRAYVNTIIHLAKRLDTIHNPQARATIIWLVGEFTELEGDESFAPDVLRLLTLGFIQEAEETKQQILLLAAKVCLNYLRTIRPTRVAKKAEKSPENGAEVNTDPPSEGANEWASEGQPTTEPAPDTTNENTAPEDEHPIPVIWDYILLLIRYDMSYDLRDRARTFQSLLSEPDSLDLATRILLAPKPAPHTPSPSADRSGLLLGSAGLVIGSKNIVGYEDLPEWVKDGEQPDPKLRDDPNAVSGIATPTGQREDVRPAAEELDRAVKAKGLSAQGKQPGLGGKSLDDWLNEEDEGSGKGVEQAEDEEEYEMESETDSEEYDDDDDDDDDEEEEGDDGSGGEYTDEEEEQEQEEAVTEAGPSGEQENLLAK